MSIVDPRIENVALMYSPFTVQDNFSVLIVGIDLKSQLFSSRPVDIPAVNHSEQNGLHIANIQF